MKSKSVLLLLLVTLLISSCAPSASPAEEPSAPIPTEEPQSIPAQIEPTSQPEQPISTAWRAVRDTRYGFGLAIPCWWIVNPIPEQGSGGAMIIKNYDEAYFNAHSNKGFWEWPNGTMKMDVIVMEGVDPAKSDADAYMQFVDPMMTGLVSAEQQQIGSQMATVATLENLVNKSDPNSKMFIFRLAPATLLMVVPYPQTVIDSPDFQAILNSIVLTPNEKVTPPTIAPAPALIEASCAQN